MLCSVWGMTSDNDRLWWWWWWWWWWWLTLLSIDSLKSRQKDFVEAAQMATFVAMPYIKLTQTLMMPHIKKDALDSWPKTWTIYTFTCNVQTYHIQTHFAWMEHDSMFLFVSSCFHLLSTPCIPSHRPFRPCVTGATWRFKFWRYCISFCCCCTWAIETGWPPTSSLQRDAWGCSRQVQYIHYFMSKYMPRVQYFSLKLHAPNFLRAATSANIFLVSP